MDTDGLSSFSGEDQATCSYGAVAAADGTGLPPTRVDMVNNNGEEADKKNVGARGGTSIGTKADHDNNNSDRKNEGDKQNHRGQQEESGPAGDTMEYHRVVINEIVHWPLYMTVLKGDLNEIRNKDPKALSSPITESMDTPLHVAIQTGRSIHFIRELVRKLPKESLLRRNRFGNTALHNAAVAGNTEAARIMVGKNEKLPQLKNKYGDIPLHRAAAYGHEEVVSFLLLETGAPSPFNPRAEARLLNYLINAGFYGYAFDVINDRPEKARFYVPTPKLANGGEKDVEPTPLTTLAEEEEKDGKRTTAKRKHVEPTPLTTLAQKPKAFESKCQAGFCKLILRCVFPGNSAHKDTDTPECGDEENAIRSSETRDSEQYGYRKGTYSHRQRKEIQAVDLLRLLIEKVTKDHPSDAKVLLAPSLETAARLGNHVFIRMIIEEYPFLVLYENEYWRKIFRISVKHRQEDVFKILLQMDSTKHFAIGLRDHNHNNMLHLAGMYEPSTSSKISGAALQLQRELQWFKAVEQIVQPSFNEEKNLEGKTPREVFTEKHKDLVKKGEEWMKDAASSCSVVAALVVTVMFAAAITVPGGNNDIGAPHFRDDTQFLIFSVSVILGLFSSSISLLMFLGMLTSRYAEDDFLEKLPRRLVIGLITLFFSLAAMLVAFGVSIYILLFHRFSWIWIPVGLIGLIPLVMFGIMQSRLLYEIVKQTCAKPFFIRKPTKRTF